MFTIQQICFTPLVMVLSLLLSRVSLAADFTKWSTQPSGSKPNAVDQQSITLTGANWVYAISPQQYENCEVAASVTISKAASQFEFFGSSWSAWPDPKFEDRGYEASMLLRGSADGSSGYRVQVSCKYQEVTLVRFPEGGYLRSIPWAIPQNKPLKLVASCAGNVIRVAIDGKEAIHYVDHNEIGLVGGHIGLGVSSGSEVTFGELSITSVDNVTIPKAEAYIPKFTSRKWLGGRTFVFDNNEPILQLHYEGDPSCFAKLMPGDKPRLAFDSHWGLENQGAFREAMVRWTAPMVSGEGDSVAVSWSAMHLKHRFETKSRLNVGYDAKRRVYTYDIDSELEVLPGEPFHFRYGFDFEHHTPLDPFRWQYLLIRDGKGQLRYRPLSPFDPGTLDDIATDSGLRVWHGRIGEKQRVAPAVEYMIPKDWKLPPKENDQSGGRALNTAVCAAFYDTGVSFAATTGQPGDRVHVRYRYTGYPADETTSLFSSAIVQDNPRIDPQHHFVFAGKQWPTIKFDDALALDKPWWGGRPFLSGHNARPTYDWISVDGKRVLRLGTTSYALAPIGPSPVEPGRYLVSATVKTENVHGPGGRIEILTLKKSDPDGNGFLKMDSANILSEDVRYFGAGSKDWRSESFVTEISPGSAGLALGLGNAGTGELMVAEIAFKRLPDTEVHIDSISKVSAELEVVKDAWWDLRMEEQNGLYVYNHGQSPHRVLELNNVSWKKDDTIAAILLEENGKDYPSYPLLGILDQNLRNPYQRSNYESVKHIANALGGGPHNRIDLSQGLTISAWVKPASQMGKSAHGGKGDIVGLGSRRFMMSLIGDKAPFILQARVNNKDRIDSSVSLQADRWYHVTMTAKPEHEGLRIRLFVDGEPVGEGTASLPTSELSVSDNIVLGAELYYLHDAYFRGSIGRVVVLTRELEPSEIRPLAKR
jgi:hypothetical protein